MRRAAMMALLLVAGCRPHGRAAGAALELPPNAADQARRFQLPRTPTGDSDRDGVLDRDDGCPGELEFYDGRADLDGCPDGGQAAVQVDEDTGTHVLAFGHELVWPSGTRLAGEPRVGDVRRGRWPLQTFEDDTTFISWRHDDVLEQIAWFLRAHPRFTRVEIEQRSDDARCDGLDCDRHAESVRFFLQANGVDARRLHVRRGFGGFGSVTHDPAFARGPVWRVELRVSAAQ
jgi:hypothetical protein